MECWRYNSMSWTHRDVYWLRQPTEWAGSPEYFSYSSLKAIERCPLQWQLSHSRYGDLGRFPARPNPRAAEGDIVHSILESLFKELARSGFPAIGDGDFQECVARVDITHSVRKQIEAYEQKALLHPRGGGRRIQKSTQQLANQVIRILRSSYKSLANPYPAPNQESPAEGKCFESGSEPGLTGLLKYHGSLSEVSLAHSDLPLKGIIDLAWLEKDGVVITDFKTGPLDAGHKEQIYCYCLLWYRSTEIVPLRGEVLYLEEKKAYPIHLSLLEKFEGELACRMATARQMLSRAPASANPGGHCGFCDFRGYCDLYWERISGSKLKSGNPLPGASPDREVWVSGKPTPYGFEAKDRSGGSIAIVFQSAEAKVHGPFCDGEHLRIVQGRLTENSREMELKSWTEVFHCPA